MRMWPGVQRLGRDMHYGSRLLRKSPGFAAVAIITLGLGIGSATAAFSIMDPWLIRPLPLKDAGRLCAVWRTAPGNPSQPAYFFGYRDYLGLAENTKSFSYIAASFHRNYTITGIGHPEEVAGEIVTANMFSTLGVVADIGRTFLPEDLAGSKVTIVSHGFWEKKLGATGSAIGQTLTLNSEAYVIIGVLPKGFSYRVLDEPIDRDVWTLIQPSDPMYQADSDSGVGIVGRLRAGVTARQAEAEMQPIQIELDHRRSPMPEIFEGTGTLVAGLQEDNTRLVRSSLLLLGAAIACVLLIACTNTAALVVGRNTGRRAEFAVRAALGSGVRRLLLQLLAENLVLYAGGALLGVLFAACAVEGFKAWNPFAALPARGIGLNLRTLGAGAGLTLATCIAFGAIPAFGATRLNLSQALHAGSRGIVTARNSLRAQTWLVATQIAISLVLLGGCALLVSTLVNLERQSFGFQTESVETFRLALPNIRYKDRDKAVQFQERLLERLRATPGVSSAALGPIFGYGDLIQTPFAILNQPDQEERDMPHAVITTISSQLFQSARIPLMRGTDFPDKLSSASDGLAVINERIASLYFADSDAIGQYIRIGNLLDAKEASHSWLRIIGIVGDTRSVAYNHLAWETHPAIYIDFRQAPAPKVSGPWGARNLSFIVSTAAGKAQGPSDLQAAVWAVDPELPVPTPESLDSVVARRLSQPRIRAQLLVVFAGISLLLTAIGIYGVLAGSVVSRRSEIAIRMAVGADRQRISRLVVGRSVMIALSGILAGTVVILGGSRLLRSMVYGISAFNPIVYCAAAALLLIVAASAAYLPARRAALVDPMSALRGD